MELLDFLSQLTNKAFVALAVALSALLMVWLFMRWYSMALRLFRKCFCRELQAESDTRILVTGISVCAAVVAAVACVWVSVSLIKEAMFDNNGLAKVLAMEIAFFLFIWVKRTFE